jgi:hypothetical protein
MEIASATLAANNSNDLVSAGIDIGKKKSRLLDSELLPCKNYYNSLRKKKNNMEFYDCCKNMIRRKLEAGA